MLTHRALSMLLVCSACGASDRSTPALDGAPGPDDASTVQSICAEQTENNPNGLKPVKYLDSSDTVYPQSDWRIALEPQAEVNWASFEGAAEHEAAMLLDLRDSSIEMAGFLISRGAASSSAVGEANIAQMAIGTVSGISTVSPRASGANITSLDGFDTVVGMSIELITSSATDVTELRDRVLPALLGRPAGEVTLPDVGWQSGSDTRFVVVMQVLYRADADQALLVGAIARAYDYDDRGRATGLHADDMSNGSNVTVSINGEAKECDDRLLDKQAQADIIWVDDESITMQDNRTQVADNATTFFQRVTDAGVDFRMGVTDIDDVKMGIFATRDAASSSGDRWLLPDELIAFQAAINKPSGPDDDDGGAEHGLTVTQATLDRHLPRSADDAAKIRPDATAVVILLTDERAQELEDEDIFNDGGGSTLMSQEQAAAIATLTAPLISFLGENNVSFHAVAVPESAPCSTEIGYGYFSLVQTSGGQFGSICQTNLDATLDAIITAIVGDASPIQLAYVPISSSITVMRDLVPVPRSREYGWDYRGSSNSIVFYGMPVDPANPADVKIGYRRWQDQVVE